MCLISFVEYHDILYHYWNPIEDEFQSVNITKLFRSEYPNGEYPVPPPTTMYTLIKLRTAFVLFWIGLLFYALLLTLIKCCINDDFRSASVWAKLQHIIEALNMPECYGDWDTDRNLDLDGHLKKWRQVLQEMLIMVLLQFVTNMCLLLPFFITGTLQLHCFLCS